jgi:twitching motility protein PilT
MAPIDAFLQLARDQGCSDLHLTIGRPPLVRLDGDLVELQYHALRADDTAALVYEILDEETRARLEQGGAVDIGYTAPTGGRYRLNAFRRLGLSAICR